VEQVGAACLVYFAPIASLLVPLPPCSSPNGTWAFRWLFAYNFQRAPSKAVSCIATSGIDLRSCSCTTVPRLSDEADLRACQCQCAVCANVVVGGSCWVEILYSRALLACACALLSCLYNTRPCWAIIPYWGGRKPGSESGRTVGRFLHGSGRAHFCLFHTIPFLIFDVRCP
jgi:hypothetical protein